MYKPTYLLLACLAVDLLAGCGVPEVDERFLEGEYVSPTDRRLPYRLFAPDGYEAEKQYPLILFLHGGQGAGTDNISQISKSNWHGSHVWIQPQVQTKYPAFVAAPQLPGLHRWDLPVAVELSTYGQLAVELIGKLQATYPIDRDRVYLTGQSRGGWGVWDLIAKRPELFAAAIPVCGGGNPATVGPMRDLPIWAFHGAHDRTVEVERSRNMVKALRAIKGEINYTEYRFSGHAIWTRAYSEDGLMDWVFAQRKGN